MKEERLITLKKAKSIIEMSNKNKKLLTNVLKWYIIIVYKEERGD